MQSGLPTRSKTYPEPLVDTFGMELVRAGQNSEHLSGLEIAHANHTRRLVPLVRIRIEFVTEQRLDF